MRHFHTTVTSGLQAVARLARASPCAVAITVPIDRAAAVVDRLIHRYPSLVQSHGTRTALRKAGLPAVQLVVMPPDSDTVTLILLSNVPPDDREQWRNALDVDEPLVWRNYRLLRSPQGSITWGLSEAACAHYRQRIARLITGRGGRPQPGERPHQLSPDSARTQVLLLASHLQRYPGLSGVRRDVYGLAQHSTRLWRNTHPNHPYPVWPTMPYLSYRQPRTAPLADLTIGDIE